MKCSTEVQVLSQYSVCVRFCFEIAILNYTIYKLLRAIKLSAFFHCLSVIIEE